MTSAGSQVPLSAGCDGAVSFSLFRHKQRLHDTAGTFRSAFRRARSQSLFGLSSLARDNITVRAALPDAFDKQVVARSYK
jgi:hypothetical protein